jgi:hypothetical protein
MGSNTGTMVKSVALDFEEFFNEELALTKSFYGELYGVKPTSQLSKKYSSIAFADIPEETAENQGAIADDVQEGYDWEVAVKSWSKKLSLTYLLKKTDQSGLHTIEEYARDLARKAVLGRDVQTMGIPFARAFDTTKTYGDGKQMISLSHPRKDSGTAQMNTFADGVQRALDYDALILLEDEFASLVSNKGVPLDIGINGNLTLMVTPLNREVAMQITECKGEPDVLTNNINYWKGRSVNLIVNPYMAHVWAKKTGITAVAKTSASNYWDSMYFLMDTTWAKKMLQMDELAGINTETEYVKDTREEIARVWDDFGVGIKGWYGIAGSKGDVSTFAS